MSEATVVAKVETTKSRGARSAGDVVLETEGLTKRFGELTAVDGLSLEVRKGEVFGFLGPNGAGKTTSISMMCGLLRPDAGRVLIGGEPIEGGAADVRARVGVCPQQLVIWGELTCIEQLVYVGEMYGVRRAEGKKRGELLLEQLGLSDKRRARARTLSGGMQRRLNVALALVHDPEIVVLDEPEAGLDPQSRVLVREYVQSLARKKTVILTTHNMDEAARVCDRVAIVDHGKLLVVDTVEKLRAGLGEGDVLELGLPATEGALELALARVEPLVGSAGGHDATLVLRARGMVQRLPAILEALHALELAPQELRLRESTLEDVFISLTGRRLRE